jgi:hypothetical protein
MKTGSSLQDIARTLESQQKSKRDFVSPSTELEFVAMDPNQSSVEQSKDAPDPMEYSLRVNGYGAFPINPIAHEQIASRVGVPQRYYDRMKAAAPELLRENVNHWLHTEKDQRMVRTLGGNVRAFLSSRYRQLDNLDLAKTTLPVLARLGVQVESTEITERRFYIKAITPKITAEVRKGDIVQAGIVITNSEIGLGSVKVEPLIFRLVCTNGLIVNDYAMRKYHIGRASEETDLAAEFFRDETREADDRAFWMKVRDVVNGSFQQDVFEKIVDTMRASTERIIDADTVKVVEVIRKENKLTEDDGSLMLKHLILGGDLTQYGLLNAVTRASQDVRDYDHATELERLGGDIMAWDGKEWSALLAKAERA